MEKNLITKKEYAILAGVAPSAVIYWQKSGSLPSTCIKIRYGKEMIDMDEIERQGVFQRHNKNGPKLPERLLFNDEEIAVPDNLDSIQFSGLQQSDFETEVIQSRIMPSVTIEPVMGFPEPDMIKPQPTPSNTDADALKASSEPNTVPSEPRILHLAKHPGVKWPEPPPVNKDRRGASKYMGQRDDEEDQSLFTLEKRARLEKLQADAAIATLNRRRAEGSLLDEDKVTPLVCELYETGVEYYAQFVEQISAAVYGVTSPAEITKIVKERTDILMERIRLEVEKKNIQISLLKNSQQKPLRF